MPNLKLTVRKTPLHPNPFKRSAAPLQHPGVWILEWIMAGVNRKIVEAEKEREKQELSEGEEGA